MNTTPIQSTRPEPAPTSIRQPRFDLYGPIHKLMRAELTELLVRMGRVDFANESAATRIVGELEVMLVACEQHIEHEVRFVHPHLAARLPNALEKIDAEHGDHARFVTELRAQINAVNSAASPELRALAGHTLYLHYNAFVADTLAHMVEEERVLQPLIHRAFTDEELIDIHEGIIRSMSPEETFRTLGGMIPAVNGPERAGILGGMHAGAPPEAFNAFIAMLRPRLDDAAWAELVGLCPFLA